MSLCLDGLKADVNYSTIEGLNTYIPRFVRSEKSPVRLENSTRLVNITVHMSKDRKMTKQPCIFSDDTGPILIDS